MRFFLTLFVFCTFKTFGQEIKYYYFNKNNAVIPEKDSALVYCKVSNIDNGITIEYFFNSSNGWKATNTEQVTKQNDSTNIVISTISSNYRDTMMYVYTGNDSIFKVKQFRRGQLITEGYATNKYPLIKTGKWNEFSSSGIKQAESEFENNECKKTFVLINGIIDTIPVYTIVDEPAKYKGGKEKLYEFIGNNIRYPKSALEKEVEGKVYIRFIIMENGEVMNPKVIRSLDIDLDEESLRVIKLMPKWIPAIKNGKSVRSYFTLPIMFKIQKK